MSKKRQVLVLHGGEPYESDEQFLQSLKDKEINLKYLRPQKGWKQSLQEELGEEYEVFLASMPQKDNAKYEQWQIIFEKLLDAVDDGVILLGHSLGGVFIVKYLSENKVEKQINKTILLAAPFNSDGLSGEALHSFESGADISNFAKQAGDVYIYHSKDDFLVPYEHMQRYCKALPQATCRGFDNLNHFLVESIPGLIDDIRRNYTHCA